MAERTADQSTTINNRTTIGGFPTISSETMAISTILTWAMAKKPIQTVTRYSVIQVADTMLIKALIMTMIRIKTTLVVCGHVGQAKMVALKRTFP